MKKFAVSIIEAVPNTSDNCQKKKKININYAILDRLIEAILLIVLLHLPFDSYLHALEKLPGFLHQHDITDFYLHGPYTSSNCFPVLVYWNISLCK